MASTGTVTQLSIPLPHSLDTRIHIHLSTKAKVATLFLTSVTQDEQSGPAALGSFVYALPNRLEPAQPISTAIYSVESTLEFTTRMAKLLAKRANMPVYVGCSINLGGAAMSLSVEEEMEAFRAIVDVVTAKLKGEPVVNGA
ncbi:hypothetical protein CPAR01_11762 [Colletotrichum paranaense]|uniref:Proteasome assembly chaperone 3 n=1 Tax=Colletotrichum paranaense TaxID=1914294 RepID=A0ABQ9S861_9PEZI|nr:uncharacterized protein CPAR01_11762 [Colletotrichum paranaense]KAK1529450.1 hypothetical protein CPAR01_11762 [Colletotrichum paranaense]